jgi:DNA modification methylase
MTVEIIVGDCRTALAGLAAKSVHCCVTSPPYFGLRDYGTARWVGGDEGCDHLKPAAHGYKPFETSTLGPKRDGISAENSAHADGTKRQQFSGECAKCGAVRSDNQIGLERTPDEFVAALVEVFREVRRVLRDDGTLWLNLGDSYSSGGRTTQVVDSVRGASSRNADNDAASGKQEYLNGTAMRPPVVAGLGSKQLLGMPWRTALALQADGWILRQDIIWSKPNPMPESVTDRCTKAHEYIFLLSKSPRYYYNVNAIKEPVAASSVARVAQNDGNPVWNGDRDRHSTQSPQTIDITKMVPADGMRNKRSVWEVATQSFSEAHFATFPPDLIEPCILAGCPPGGVVLDPFGGAGTTGLVADRLQRNAVLVELNPAYADMARRRIHDDSPLFAGAAQ